MKIRTDFVTNLSSSSFVLEVVIAEQLRSAGIEANIWYNNLNKMGREFW